MFSFLIHFFHLFFFIALVCLFFCVCVFVLLQIFSRFFSLAITRTHAYSHTHTHTFISVCFYNVSLNYVVSFNLRNYSFLCFFLFFSFLYNYLFVSFVVAVCFNLLVCHVYPLPSACVAFVVCCVLLWICLVFVSPLSLFRPCLLVFVLHSFLSSSGVSLENYLQVTYVHFCSFLLSFFLCCYMCAFSVDFCS